MCDGITEERNKQSNQEDETSKKNTLVKEEFKQNHSAIPHRYSGFKKEYKKLCEIIISSPKNELSRQLNKEEALHY